MIDITALRQRYAALSDHLDERAGRIFAATDARMSGYGGIAAVARARGIAASTIGLRHPLLAATEALDLGRSRRPGGGGKKRVAQASMLVADLLALVEPDARGDPLEPLRWTCKSLRMMPEPRRGRARSHRHSPRATRSHPPRADDG